MAHQYAIDPVDACLKYVYTGINAVPADMTHRVYNGQSVTERDVKALEREARWTLGLSDSSKRTYGTVIRKYYAWCMASGKTLEVYSDIKVVEFLNHLLDKEITPKAKADMVDKAIKVLDLVRRVQVGVPKGVSG